MTDEPDDFDSRLSFSLSLCLSAVCLSPWCVKHDECVLVTCELAVEGLIGELQDILLVGERAEQKQGQDCQALSQHRRRRPITHESNYGLSGTGRRPSSHTWLFYSMRRSPVTRPGPRSVVARRLAGQFPHLSVRVHTGRGIGRVSSVIVDVAWTTNKSSEFFP